MSQPQRQRIRYPGRPYGHLGGLFSRFARALRMGMPRGGLRSRRRPLLLRPVPRPRMTPPRVVNQPTLQRFGHPLPGPGTLNYLRGPNGLITHVNGRPVNVYVQALSGERNDLYRRMRADQTVGAHFTKAQIGAMHSVLLDRRTGAIFEADNRTLGRTQPTNLHPTLQTQLDAMDASARRNPEHYDYGNGNRGGFPHPDTPGTHSEVASANQALWARQEARLPAGHGMLQEFVVDNRRIFGRQGTQAPCCANCTSILGDIEAIPGRKLTFP